MAYNKLLFSLFTIFSFFLSSSSLEISLTLSSLIPSSTLCNFTPHPSFCKSILPNNPSTNVYDYGRISIRKSISYAQKFLSLIETYLARSSSLSSPTVMALQDCKLLAELNLELLSSSYQVMNSSSTVLAYDPADDTQTSLSTVLTNIDTCLDGIEETNSASSVKDGLFSPLYDNARLYSVTLAFFKKGWVPKSKPKVRPTPNNKKHLFRNGKLNIKVSKKHQPMFKSEKGLRKLLELSSDVADAVMVSDIVTVGRNGSTNFTTINDAIGAAPNNTNGSSYYLIYITAGVYQEYVSIASNKKYLLMVGDGINQTIITGNHSVADNWTTFNSPTFAVVAKGFVAVNITFQNTAGPIKHQAVAMRSGADSSTFYSCSFEGYQDTLYVHSQRQFYKNCDIYGTVDFIFGNAASMFQNCNIYPRLPMKGQFNAITAQGRTDPNMNTGISAQNCTIRAADDLAAGNFTVQTYLGRPWKLYSTTVFMQSFMDSLIHPTGWHVWDGDFALNTSYYAEFYNYGPGSNTSGRVTWPGFHIINATEAANFTTSNLIIGDTWLPQTGVPYFGGLC